ncbi:Hypothetical protein SMAX5B_010659 [Scophthalmus maximus]|uniref:Uncharacterized protein n=1 Tax=Scophthalmus maximus TaxID=52904 RepID=A0A2U9B2N3_SCOMX|nr:Hypothetical protein SMAX5B_010659 [Scophthalmus maximus]
MSSSAVRPIQTPTAIRRQQQDERGGGLLGRRRVVMSGKTPVSADVGISAGY